MVLKNLLNYSDIVIQVHDNPDADAVGSGFAIYSYLKSNNIKVRLIYSGMYKIKKSNMRIFIEELNIPIEYVTTIDIPELLLTIDCQYGEGNVTKFEARNIAIIDHHNTGRTSDKNCEIRSHIVSCSTICYDMLKKAGYDINANKDVATALYYGMYMDSNGFSEIRHPLERDMMDYLRVDRILIKRLINSNFSIQELETAGIAMLRYSLDEVRGVSIIKANQCDPNILGIIGDMVLQVDSVNVSIVYNKCQNGYKLSVRSCIDTVAANDLADFLTKEVGNGGGHIDKAGGFISEKSLKEIYPEYSIETYFFNKVTDYYSSFEIIYAKNGIENKKGFKLYEKKIYECGYVVTTDIFETGTEIRVRTLEGDVFVRCSNDIYLMIGVGLHIYPIERKVFEQRYTPVDENYLCEYDYEYEPSVADLNSNDEIGLFSYAKTCRSMEKTRIYAKRLDKSVKIFTKWNYERYMFGDVGDYICYSEDDEKDIYSIKKDIFDKTYKLL